MAENGEKTREGVTPSGIARAVMRRAVTASLGTRLAENGSDSSGWPYVSLVLAATDHAARPLLLLSDLAVHTSAIRADARIALLFDATIGLADPLTGARVSVLGRVEPVEDEALLARFVARHPSAAGYAGFDDFRLYKMTPERAHLVAGFGRISWIEAPDLLFDSAPCSALAAAEADIVAHMNADHGDALEAYATGLLGLDGGAWRMAGIDPEGCDLRRGSRLARLDFNKPVDGPKAARSTLVSLAAAARQGKAPEAT